MSTMNLSPDKPDHSINYKIAVMKAHARGEVIESIGTMGDPADQKWELNLCPLWDWMRNSYRVKRLGQAYAPPPPEFVPFNQHYVGPGYWFKKKKGSAAWAMVGVNDAGVFLHTCNVTWQELYDSWECSTNLKEWHPCQVRVR